MADDFFDDGEDIASSSVAMSDGIEPLDEDDDAGDAVDIAREICARYSSLLRSSSADDDTPDDTHPPVLEIRVKVRRANFNSGVRQ